MKKHKAPWSSIIESIFGTGDQALPQQGQPHPNSDREQMAREAMQPPGSMPTKPPSAEMQAFSGQGGQAKDQLLQAMQALSQQLRQ